MLPRAVRCFAGFAALTLAACGPKATGPQPLLVTLVSTPAGLGDGAINDAAAAGLQRCARATNATVDVMAPPAAGETEPKLVLAATENRAAVIALGAAAAAEVQRTARRFQATHFAIVDGVVDEANVDSIVFKDEEGAFLAGALAALVAPAHHVGFVGGKPGARSERSAAGFTAGARAIDPAARVDVRYVGSYTDRDGAQRVANALYGEGASVLFSSAGPAGLGTIDAAKARTGAYAIGADADQDALAPGKVLTSVVKHVDRATERICHEAVAQKPVSGRVFVGLADGAISLTAFPYTRAAIGAPRLAKLERLRAAIVAGTLRPPASLAELGRFRAVALR